MKIVSWNLSCFRKQGAFAYALANLSADIYFFQECHHPLTYLPKVEHKSFIGKYIWEPTENGWGNCILSVNDPVELVDIDTKLKGRVLAGKLKNHQINVVNLHIPVIDGYSRHGLESAFNEINPLVKDKRLIVAGDLNFGGYFDKNGKTFHRDLMQNLLTQSNLVSCFHKFHELEKQTFRSPRKQTECMIDYIFVSKDLEGQVKACDVLKDDLIVAMSDHNPLCADIAL